jgi:FkbM family methyltransferase
MKKILIAIPTSQYIEADTFKSIYDQHLDSLYSIDFVPFISDQIEQVRNEIAVYFLDNGYDYLFAVDSDIVFAPDTLQRLIDHDVDMVSGIYIQRIPGTHTIEIMRKNEFGGVTHVPYSHIKDQGLVPIDGCGFGCVLIKRKVFESMEYPYFVYKSALDHAHTVSEDVYFCRKATEKNIKMYADSELLCDHVGSWTFRVDRDIKPESMENKQSLNSIIESRLRELHNSDLLPQQHTDYLIRIRDEFGVKPRIIYDIGGSVLHWTTRAKQIWPDSQYIVFEAVDQVEFLYKEHDIEYHLGFIGDTDDKQIEFYQNLNNPGGNSRYRENPEFSLMASELYGDHSRVYKKSMTLDTVVTQRNFPLPDLIKIDVQGSELDVLCGASKVLENCKDIILELQHVEYNRGAPLNNQVIDYLQNIGFQLVTPLFTNNGPDGDYHFRKI